jgi:hypothetical protein
VKSRLWYRIALATKAGAPQLVLASGDHPGAAIAEAEHEVPGSWAIAFDVATAEEIPLGESVGKGHVVRIGPAPAGLSTFAFPPGALPAVAGGVHTMVRGWVKRSAAELLVLEAQTDADHLVDLYLGMIERLPSADNLEIRVLDHYDAAGQTDVWLTSRIDAKKILRFLDDHDAELFGNGHVELSVYVRAHRATLRLTSHKTVLWLAEGTGPNATDANDGHGGRLEAEVTRWFGELAVPEVAVLPSVTDGAYHHYRTAASRDRKKLGDELFKQRLRKVDTVRVS